MEHIYGLGHERILREIDREEEIAPQVYAPDDKG
jgi:hypothetical protein